MALSWQRSSTSSCRLPPRIWRVCIQCKLWRWHIKCPHCLPGNWEVSIRSKILNYAGSSCPRGSHPHKTVDWGPHIWVVNLGCDMIHHHWWTGSVLWEGNSTSVTQGRGPRHMEVHPWRNIAFVVCELQNYLEVYEFDVEYGNMTKLQELTLTSQKSNAGAEIVIVESGVDLNIYVSSRGLGVIELFKMKGTEKKLLAVGDQKENNVELVNIDLETGQLSAGTTIQPGDGPRQPSFLTFFQTWKIKKNDMNFCRLYYNIEFTV